MAWIYRAVKKFCSFAMSPRVSNRVSFSPSTINMQRERTMRNIASPIPFQNFLNELRLTALDEHGKDHMTMRESSMMRKSGVRLWSLLSEEQKNKYRQLAINASDTRLPVRLERKSAPFLEPDSVQPDIIMDSCFLPSRTPRNSSFNEQVDKTLRKRYSTKKTTKTKKPKNSMSKASKRHLARSRSVPQQSPRETSRAQAQKRKHESSLDPGSANEEPEAVQTPPELDKEDEDEAAEPLQQGPKRRRTEKSEAD